MLQFIGKEAEALGEIKGGGGLRAQARPAWAPGQSSVLALPHSLSHPSWACRHRADLDPTEGLCAVRAPGALRAVSHSELMLPGAKATLGTQAWAGLASENPWVSPPTPFPARGFLRYPNMQPRCSQPCDLEGQPLGACRAECAEATHRGRDRHRGQSGFPAPTWAGPARYLGEGKTGWIGQVLWVQGGPS